MIGTENASFDVLFAKPLKMKSGENSQLGLFTRNRVEFPSFNNEQNSPFFLSLNILSYNLKWSGNLNPVLQAQVDNFGFTLKTGLQWLHIAEKHFFLIIATYDIYTQPLIDNFLVYRWFPQVSNRLVGFLQFEMVNLVPINTGVNILKQRLKLGRKKGDWQYGFGLDHNWIGVTKLQSSFNPGLFVRYEFL
ncbi:hypothetical protein [Luteibaculum oceani]|uniref:Uncharacterized protein n=1 Tax=Luteibaculum oceani TaxID=1294296 RepID=A0A5C6V1V6_9FLAO|nr:hypothetical protein [Luteibaculum oceani]TXC76985.1 hypothetical protein FRX97_10260 [Luteibaculum oceani]